MFITMDSDVHTLESNISDQYSLLIDTKIIFRKNDCDTEFLTRNLIALQKLQKAETVYKYLFVPQQKLKKVSSFQDPYDQVVFITNEIIEIVDRFAPITRNRKFKKKMGQQRCE